MSKPTKAEAIVLFDMIEKFGDDESQDTIRLLHGTLTLNYHAGYADALKMVAKKQKAL